MQVAGPIKYQSDPLRCRVLTTTQPAAVCDKKMGRGQLLPMAIRIFRTVVAAFLAASFVCSATLAAEPKRVMVLHSFGRDFKPWSEYAKTIRMQLDRQSPWPMEITDQSLVTARSADENPEVPFVEYLRALFARRPLDLIVSIGAPAASFVQRHRQQLFATTPMVFTAVEQRRIQRSSLTENDAVVPTAHDFPALVENILHVLPDTKTVAWVLGASPNEKRWLEDVRRELAPFADRLSFIWYDDRSFADILKHAASLPPHSAIFWHLMNVDAAGVVHEGDTGLPRLYEVANAPIFTFDDSFFGREIVGGPMHSVLGSSQDTAAVVVRILGGEKAGDVEIPARKYSPPIFDWRLMQRWGISERNLPPGSKIFFREASAWQKYQMAILLIVAAILFQAGLISWLVYEHRRRHTAELTARGALAELTQMNRIAGAGQLSASIAHEVNQPLGAISSNASAALNWLKARTPNIDEASAALTRIKNDSHRASDIVSNLRAMFKKDGQQTGPVEVNKVILSVLELVRIELQERDIKVRTQLDDRLPTVTSSEVQLQQVVLNLIMNAKDAMQSASSHRELFVRSEQSEPGWVQVSIEDSGPGISPSDLERIFQPMFTTKSQGMGMGLAICRSIMEAHGGRVWVASGSQTGAAFQFSLPASGTKAGLSS
jgi:signal transduction histidine kinase